MRTYLESTVSLSSLSSTLATTAVPSYAIVESSIVMNLTDKIVGDQNMTGKIIRDQNFSYIKRLSRLKLTRLKLVACTL